jgi:hypothetical protein
LNNILQEEEGLGVEIIEMVVNQKAVLAVEDAVDINSF